MCDGGVFFFFFFFFFWCLCSKLSITLSRCLSGPAAFRRLASAATLAKLDALLFAFFTILFRAEPLLSNDTFLVCRSASSDDFFCDTRIGFGSVRLYCLAIVLSCLRFRVGIVCVGVCVYYHTGKITGTCTQQVIDQR